MVGFFLYGFIDVVLSFWGWLTWPAALDFFFSKPFFQGGLLFGGNWCNCFFFFLLGGPKWEVSFLFCIDGMMGIAFERGVLILVPPTFFCHRPPGGSSKTRNGLGLFFQGGPPIGGPGSLS